MTSFSDFAKLCEQLTSTSKRLEKSRLLADFLSTLDDAELRLAPLFILGKAFADHDARTLDVSWRTLQRVSENLPTRDTPASLTLVDVGEAFTEIAQTSGKGSRRRIDDLLIEMLSHIAASEQKWLFKIFFGEMRTGVAEGVLLEGIARAANTPLELVRRANMYLGDPGEVAFVALRQGGDGLGRIDLQLFRPVQPMLAELAEDFSKVFREHGGRTSLEYKLDGARVQIHLLGDRVRIYSRHLSDVTDSLPDVIEMVRQNIECQNAIVEGEVVAVGENDRPLPFQDLMRRFRRIHGVAASQIEIPTRLFLFDLLLCDGVPHIDIPYEQRWERLQQIADPKLLVTRVTTNDENEAADFLRTALDQGHEGLMAKRLDSEYTPGSRGKRWFKIKTAETLDLIVVAAEWGSGRRVGWLSNYHLAARDETNDELTMLGKTFKGLTDEQFKWMTSELQKIKTHEDSYTVYVKPQLIVEVAYNEIQRSPHYNSGFALRFARIKKIREDKAFANSDTIQRVRLLYEQQFERKARASDIAQFK